MDLEPNMVRRLRERAAGRPGSADLEAVAADLRSLDLHEVFDLVIVQREAFQMFVDRGDALRVLTSLRRHLAPGGTLVVDVASFDRGDPPAPELQPGYFDPELPDGVEHVEWTKPLPWGGTVTRSRVQRRPDPGTVEIGFSYDLRGPDGTAEAWSTELRLAIRSRPEMLALAAEAGLAPEQIWSDYDRSPDRPGAVRTIFLFRHGEDDPLVGWIRGAGEGFVNDRDALRLTGFDGADLDAARLDYFRRYLDKYFNERFLFGMGTEEILAGLARHGTGGRWLDLGAGTTTLFWSIPLTGITSIACCDLVVEALAVLDEFARSDRVPACYRDALALCGRPESHLADLRRRIGAWLVFDTLAPWPSWLAAERFDLITAFGSFGIAPDPERYTGCFRSVASHLAAGGRAVGADWVRRPELIAWDGHDNSYLAPDQVVRSGEAAGLAVLDCREVPITGDPSYRAVIFWALEKPRHGEPARHL